MKAFSQTFHIEGKPVRFLFSPVVTTEATRYFVTVADLREHTFNFEMQEVRPATWRVVLPAPLWIQTMEAELGRLLNTKNSLASPEPGSDNGTLSLKINSNTSL